MFPECYGDVYRLPVETSCNHWELCGVTSQMTGSIAKPCISQWNCSMDMGLKSSDDQEHVKCQDFTRL